MIIGAIILPLSQLPGKVNVYQLEDTVNFVQGQPMEFNWTFVKGEYYQFEVLRVSWTGVHTLSIQVSGSGGWGSLVQNPPWVWTMPSEGAWEASGGTVEPWNQTRTNQVIFSALYSGDSPVEAEQGTHVNIYKAVETTSKPYDYLLYFGASVAIVGAAIAAIGAAYPDALQRRQEMERPGSK